jgi:hypothetical protein
MRSVLVIILAVGLFAAGCGSSPSGPSGTSGSSSNTVATPAGFRVTVQRVNFTNNEVTFGWSGTASSYRISAGTASGLSDVFSIEVSTTSYAWTAPREATVYYVRVVAIQNGQTSAASPELPIFTIDLRDVIDALFFRSGPMADTPGTALSNPSAGVWPSNTRLTVLVSEEAGETARSKGQTFLDDYAGLGGLNITASSAMTPNDYRSSVLGSIPEFTIAMRVLANFCGSTGVIACANYGPAPIGLNRSIVTLNTAAGHVAASHELGHAYGMGHVRVNGSVRAELNFMMNPSLVSEQMTEPRRTPSARLSRAACAQAGRATRRWPPAWSGRSPAARPPSHRTRRRRSV